MNDFVVLSIAQWTCISNFIRNMADIAGIESNIDEETLSNIFDYFIKQELELFKARLE